MENCQLGCGDSCSALISCVWGLDSLLERQSALPAGTCVCVCVCVGLREIETEQKWNYACLWSSSWHRLLPTGSVWFTCSPVNQMAKMPGHFSFLFPSVNACYWLCLHCNLFHLQVVMNDAPCFLYQGLLWSCQAGVQWRRQHILCKWWNPIS